MWSGPCPVRRVAIGIIRIGCIPDVAPDPFGLALAIDLLILHRHACVIGMDDLRLFHALDHQLMQRPDQFPGGQHPGAHRAAGDVDALAAEDALQPVQRRVIGQLTGDHIRQQSRPPQM